MPKNINPWLLKDTMRRGSGGSGRKIDYRKNKKGHKLLKRLAYKYSLTRKRGK